MIPPLPGRSSRSTHGRKSRLAGVRRSRRDPKQHWVARIDTTHVRSMNNEAGPPGPASAFLTGARSRCGRSGGGNCSGRGPGADLVEAGAAVDRPIVAWSEWHSGLPTALAADGGVVLARSSCHSGALGHSPTAWAALRIVLETLAHEEGLLSGGEEKLLVAVPAGQRPVLVHPVLHVCTPWRGRGSRTGRPFDMHARIRAPSTGW